MSRYKDWVWHRCHKDEVSQILDAFTDIAFQVENDDSLLDDDEKAKEFFLLGEICGRLLRGKRIKTDQIESLLRSERYLLARPAVSSQPKAGGVLAFKRDWRSGFNPTDAPVVSNLTPYTAAIAEYRAARALGDREAMAEALGHVRFAASSEYARRYGMQG